MGMASSAAQTTSERMAGIRQRDTAPEVAFRQIVHRMGLRFRVCPSNLPGRPDLANVRAKWAVFVHGCFWHGHASCKLYRVPKTNSTFWIEKVRANKARDARKESALRAAGFLVVVVWQCEIDSSRRLDRRLRALASWSRRGRR